MELLRGKVALITGGARGQGRAHAITCAREGADVVIVDTTGQIESVPYRMATEDDLAQTVAAAEEFGRGVAAHDVDVRDQAAIDNVVSSAIDRFGGLDVAIINHGIWSWTPFWELTDAEWEDMIGVNLTGVWKCAKAVAPHMIERESGSIVVTSSTNALEPGFGYSHYSTAKHGVVGLVKNIAYELAPHGVRCNSVAPGLTQSPMVENQKMYDVFAGQPGGSEEDLLTTGKGFHALKGVKMLPAQAMADAALWLNSDLASHVTGVTVPVDAGHLLLAGFNHDPKD